MPLPSTCPKEFALMPEHFVEDAMELLIFHSRIPKAFDGVVLVGLMIKCFTMQFCLLYDMGNIVFFARALYMNSITLLMRSVLLFCLLGRMIYEFHYHVHGKSNIY